MRAEVTACLSDFPPAMMVPHESRRNPRPRARRRIFLRPQSLRHCRDARPAPALRRSAPAARLAGSFSSMGSRNRHRALFSGVLRGQNSLLRHFLGRPAHLHSPARRRSPYFRRCRRCPAGMAMGRRLARRRSGPNLARHKSQRPRCRQYHSRTIQQLVFEFRRRCPGRVADLDGHNSSPRHHHHRCRTRRALRFLALPSIQLASRAAPSSAC